MRSVLPSAAGIVLAGALASSAQAADMPPAGPEVHRMVILNGSTYSTHYFSVGLSASDQAALHDLESAENNAYCAADLQALRRQYVADESILAPHRAAVQQALYGVSLTRSYSSQYAYGGYGGYGGYGNGSYGGGFYPDYLTGFAPYGFGYGGYGYGLSSGFAGFSSSVNESLANGVGNEGALQTAMAPVIASQANSEFATSAGRAYTAAINRAGESDAMRTALGMPKRGVAAAADVEPRHVVLTLKQGTGDKVQGALVDEDADWITVATGTGDVSVRKADVVRIEHPKSNK